MKSGLRYGKVGFSAKKDLDCLNDIRDAQMLYRVPRHQFVRSDPLEYHDENEFVKRFRFTKTEIRMLEGLIGHRQEAEHVNRGTNITPMEQLLLTIRYLATGSSRESLPTL